MTRRGLDTHLARALLESESVEYSLLHEALTRVRAQRQAEPRTLALELLELGLIEAEEVERTLARLVGQDSQARAWEVGSLVAGLEICGHLGTGGMGEVYLAQDTQTGSRVAVKTLPLGGDDDLLARFQREAEAQARVDSHQHVVKIHRSGFAEGRAFLVMDAVSGGDLSQRLEAGPLQPSAAAALVRDLSQGLAHAHERGVLHRDLKPSNILFDELGAPRLADFGLARLVEAEGLTQTGQILGTPGYMAPEQACGEAQDERTDVYGLGGVLYAALTCSAPCSGGSVFATLDQVLTGPVPDPRALAPATPPALAAICQRCLAKSPNDRYPSAQAVGEALEEFLAGAQPSRRGLGLVAAALSLLIAAALLVLSWPRPGPKPEQVLPPRTPSSPAPTLALTKAEVKARVAAAGSNLAQAELALRFLEEGLQPESWLERRAQANFLDVWLPALAGVDLLPSGHLLVWTDMRVAARKWGVQVRESETENVIRSDQWGLLAISPTKQRLALRKGGKVRIVVAETWRLMDEFPAPPDVGAHFLTEEALVLADGTRLSRREVGGSGTTPWGLSLDSVVTGFCPNPEAELVYVAFGRDSPYSLHCYSRAGELVWSVEGFEARARALTLSRDGKALALGTASGAIHVFDPSPLPRGPRALPKSLEVDPETKDLLLDGRAYKGGVRSLLWLSNGLLLSVGGEKKSSIHLWSRTGECLARDLVAGKRVDQVVIDEEKGRIYLACSERLLGALCAPTLPGALR